MRKRSILFLTLLAVGAFFARSPEAARSLREFFLRPGEAQSIARESGTGKRVTMLRSRLARARFGGDSSRQADAARLTGTNSGVGSGSADAATVEGEVTESNQDVINAVAAVADGDLRQRLESSLAENATNTEEFRELILRRWTETDPKAAASWATSFRDPAMESWAVTQTATVWADKDLAGALEWVNALPEGKARDAAILAMGYEAARTNSGEAFAAFDLAASLAPSAERDALLLHFVRQWSATEPNAAVDWASRVPDSGLREQLLGAAAITAAVQDPQAAASLIATNLKPGQAQDQAAVAIVQRWAQTDPQAAASWASEFPDENVKAAALAALASAQAVRDELAN